MITFFCRTMTSNSKRRTTEDLKREHDCSSLLRFCTNCRTDHIPSNQCPMQFNKMEKHDEKFCFVALSNSKSSLQECYSCYQLGKLCKIHQSYEKMDFDYCNFLISAREVRISSQLNIQQSVFLGEMMLFSYFFQWHSTDQGKFSAAVS